MFAIHVVSHIIVDTNGGGDPHCKVKQMPFCCATAPTIFVLLNKFLLGLLLELVMVVKKT